MTKRKTDEAFQSLIDGSLGPFLREHEFIERRKWFCRRRGEAVHVVAPCLRKVRHEDAGWLFVGVHVGVSSLADLLRSAPHEISFGTLDPKFPSLMGTDLGHLGPPYNLTEWPISPKTRINELAEEIVRQLRERAFPVFERFRGLDSFIEALEQGFIMNSTDERASFLRAAGYALRGDVTRAIGVVECQVASADQEWRQRGMPKYLGGKQRAECFLSFIKSIAATKESRR